MLFSLKFQRDNRKNALAVDSAKGKTGKSLYFHHAVEIKQPHATIGLLKRMSGIHLAIPVFSKGYRPKQGKVAP